MTILLSVASQQYTPRIVTVPFTVPAGSANLLLSLTRQSWPAGAVGSIGISYPSGLSAGGASFVGGDLLDLLGQLLASSTLSLLPLRSEATVPAGVYSVAVTILQTVTTAVTVEAF